MFMKDHRERNIRPSQKTHPNVTEIAKEARFRFPRTIQLLSPAQLEAADRLKRPEVTLR
jgi:hypothetical protein